MNKLKDIYYDLNDIMVALIIVAIAALVIVTNIDSILNYPSVIAAEAQTHEEQTPTHYAENPPIANEGGGDTTAGRGTTDAAVGGGTTTVGGVTGNTGTGEVDNYSVYINPGETGDQIADKMIGVGLFKDRQQFHDAVAAAGAEGKLRAGNFIIPSNATPAEVISILIK